jgi:hypothetical protein
MTGSWVICARGMDATRADYSDARRKADAPNGERPP